MDPAVEMKAATVNNCNIVGSLRVPKFDQGAEEERQFIFRRTGRVYKLKCKLTKFIGKTSWKPMPENERRALLDELIIIDNDKAITSEKQ